MIGEALRLPADGQTPDGARQALDGALLAAHERHDGEALVRLYSDAGGLAEARGDIDAACFYYTHAYVYALEAGVAAARELCVKLASHGREEMPRD